MTRSNYQLIVLLTLTIFISSCVKEEKISDPESDSLRMLIASKSKDGTLESLVLPESNNFTSIPQDPKNPLSSAKVELGRMLFHESALAINPKNAISMGTYSCASCHNAGAGFQSGIRQGIGDGGIGYGTAGEMRKKSEMYPIDMLDIQPLKSPSVLNTAYQKLMLWNGQFGATENNEGTEVNWFPGSPIANNHLGFEGLEIQAIAGFGVHRMGVNVDLLDSGKYKELFAAAYPNSQEASRYSSQKIGMAIAAYERTVLANKAPFQEYLRGDDAALSSQQKEGAALFFDKANCAQCHNGPGLNNMEFHAVGMGALDGPGVYALETNAELGRGSFTGKAKDMYAFKVPQLYNLKDARFYGHGATFTSIEEVIRYKNAAIAQSNDVQENQLSEHFVPLQLTEGEIEALTDFVENGLYDPDLQRYEPSDLPSGSCVPNNDEMSKSHRGCN